MDYRGFWKAYPRVGSVNRARSGGLRTARCSQIPEESWISRSLVTAIQRRLPSIIPHRKTSIEAPKKDIPFSDQFHAFGLDVESGIPFIAMLLE